MEKEEIRKLNESINIVDYARFELGFNLVKLGRYFTCKEHDSLRIYPGNSFCRFSTGAGGFAVNFIKEFNHLAENNYSKALDIAVKYIKENNLIPQFKIEEKSKDNFEKTKTRQEYLDYLLNVSEYRLRNPILPVKNNNNYNIIKYLTEKRKLDPIIVDKWINKGLIYEDIHTNIVMVGKDFNNDVKYGHIKSIEHSNRYDIDNSAKIVGVAYINKNAKRLYVTESVIDAMSIMQMTQDYNANYLSIQGTTNVEAVLFYLMIHGTKLDKLFLCLDKDSKGKQATMKIIDKLDILNKYEELNTKDFEMKIILPINKDFNEDLVEQMEYLNNNNIEIS